MKLFGIKVPGPGPGRGKPRKPLAHLERFEDLALAGWAVGREGALADVRVLAGGRPARLHLRRHERADVRAKYPQTRDLPYGVSAEIDASAWELADPAGALDIEIRIDGLPLGAPRQITVAQLDDWWLRIEAMPPSDAREHQTLRLIAHAAAAGAARLLPETAGALDREAHARGLGDAFRRADVDTLRRVARQVLALEQADGLSVEGWAFDPEGAAQAFELWVDGQPVEAAVTRKDRFDVQRALGAAESALGFRLELPPEIWRGALGLRQLEIRVQGKRVSVQPLRLDADEARALIASLDATGGGDTGSFDDAVSQGRSTMLLRAALEGYQDLVLVGWVSDPAAGGEVFRLQCNGHDVPCFVTRTHRQDVRNALGRAATGEFLGFEIEIPPAVWRHAEDGVCQLALLVNDKPLPFGEIRVDRALLEAMAARRLEVDDEKALRAADPKALRGRMLAWLLLEHVAASGGIERLSPDVQEALRGAEAWHAVARRFGLGNPALGWDGREAQKQRRRAWRLQRRFNLLIERGLGQQASADPSRSVDFGPIFDEILADPDATGAVRTELLLSLVPALCRNPGAVARLQAELPLDVQAFHAARGDNWQRSLYLVGLAHAGRFEEAASVLQRIVANPGQGWLNTDCIDYAVARALQPLGVERLAADEAANDSVLAPGAAQARFLVRVIELFDALPGGAWSRHHDRALVSAAAQIVRRAPALAATAVDGAGAPALPPADLAALRRGALRHYGLEPSFWRQLDDTADDDPPLRRGRDDFDALRATLTAIDAGHIQPAHWHDTVERLRVQHAQGHPDAAACLRELALAIVARTRAAGQADHPAWRYVCESLGLTDPMRLDGLPGFEPDPTSGTARLPPSLWPTSSAPPPLPPLRPDGTGREAAADNRLELLSPPGRAAELLHAPMLVVCVVRNEMVMLPWFLAHYRALGVRHFVFIDNASDDGSRAWLLAQPDVVLYAADTDYRDSHYGVAWQQAVLAAHAQGKWALLADADELLMYDGWETRPLAEVLAALDHDRHDAAEVLMLDLYPAGRLRDTDFAQAPPQSANAFDRQPLVRWHLGTGLYSNSTTWLSALRHRLIPQSPPNAFTAQKIALFRYRPWVRLSEGLHYAAGLRPAPAPLFFGHYKYHAGFREKVLREIERKQHYDGASEYAHYLAMVAEEDATFFDPHVSIGLENSADLPALGPA